MRTIGAVIAMLAEMAVGAAFQAPAAAQTSLTSTINARSGQPAGLVMLFNCTSHILPGYADGSAAHGKVKAEKTTANVCGNPKEPVWEFTYTSNPGYKGDDEATLYVNGDVSSMKVVVQ
jgi:hypothetical protein